MPLIKHRIKTEHLNKHIGRAKMWTAVSVLAALAGAYAGALIAYPTALIGERGLSAGSLDLAGRALSTLALDPALLVRTLVQWIEAEISVRGFPPVTPIVTTVVGMVGAGLAVFAASGPHSFRETHLGAAEWADEDFLEENDFFAKSGLVLGRFGHPLKGRPIRYPETLSMMMIAPPGTGKTVSLVSNIVSDHPDKGVATPCPSLIINDPKGEIYTKTAGYRSTLGPVYHIRWTDLEGSCFNPLSVMNIPGGDRIGPLLAGVLEGLTPVYVEPKRALAAFMIAARDFGEVWRTRCRQEPDMAFAVAGSMPGVERVDLALDPAAAGRRLTDELFDRVVELNGVYTSIDSYVNRLCAIAVPEGNGQMDSHWIVNGRAALSGFLLFQVFESIYETLERGEPREATFGGMLSWLASSDVDPDDKPAHDLSQPPDAQSVPEPEAGGEDDDDDDEVSRLLLNAIAKARSRGYPARVAEELGSLRQKPPRERGSVISTAIGKLNIFKSAAIRARTSRSDLTFSNLRGLDGRPVTVYFDVPLEDAEAVGIPTGFFIEGAAAYLISQTEREARTRPVVFQLDEFWTLPKMEVIQQIPALGRGQWVQLNLIGQSDQQVALKLGEKALDVLKDAIAIRIYFAIASFKQAKEVSDSIGQITLEQANQNNNFGLDMGDMFKGQISRSFQGVPLVRPEELMSLEKLNPGKRKWGECVIQMAGFMSRPIRCRPMLWFKDRTLRRRVGLRRPDFVEGPRGVWQRNWRPRREPETSVDAPAGALAAHAQALRARAEAAE